MANHVFITHAVEDKKIAELVCEALESNGIQCWIAPRDVPYGMNFEEAIVDAICESSLMILILSNSSNNSPHVKREIQNACMEDAQTPILPFRVEDLRLNKALRYYLGSTQWLDASTPPLESHFESLVKRVRVYLSQDAQAEAATKAEAEAARQQAEAEALPHRLAAEEAAREEAEAEAARKAEAETARQRAEAEALAREQAEAEARRLAEEEAARKEAQAEAARRAEAEATRQRAEAARKVDAEAVRQRAEAEALFRRQAESTTAEERALIQPEIQRPDKRRVEPLPFSGFTQSLEQPDRRLWYIGGGAMLALAIIIVAAVAYSTSQNTSQQTAAVAPSETNSPAADQVSGSSKPSPGLTNPPVNSDTVADPHARVSPVPSPSTARPSPERPAASEDPEPSPARQIPGGVLNGKAISLPKPPYPPLARRAGASGTVVVQVLIDENGNVVSARAVSGHPLLLASAAEAARQAKFSPTRLSGQPVKVSGVIQYNFVAPTPSPPSTTP